MKIETYKPRKNAPKRIKRGKKSPSITKLMRECDKAFSIKVRRLNGSEPAAEWNICFTCGRHYPVKKLHCGHYLSRFYKAARWDYDNARPQCMMCNMWKRGDPIVFRRNLIKEIGIERVEAVEAKRNVSIKLTRDFLTAKLAELATSQL